MTAPKWNEHGSIVCPDCGMGDECRCALYSHGKCGCCLTLAYLLSILTYQLDTYEKGSDAWNWAADLMDEAGK